MQRTHVNFLREGFPLVGFEWKGRQAKLTGLIQNSRTGKGKVCDFNGPNALRFFFYQYDVGHVIDLSFEAGPREARVLFEHMRPDLHATEDYIGRYFETWRELNRFVQRGIVRLSSDGTSFEVARGASEDPFISLNLADGSNEYIASRPDWGIRNALVFRAESKRANGSNCTMNFSEPSEMHRYFFGRGNDPAKTVITLRQGTARAFELFRNVPPTPEGLQEFLLAFQSDAGSGDQP